MDRREQVRPEVYARLGRDTLTEVERAMVAATTDLEVGPAEIVLVALDDLVLDPIPHNDRAHCGSSGLDRRLTAAVQGWVASRA